MTKLTENIKKIKSFPLSSQGEINMIKLLKIFRVQPDVYVTAIDSIILEWDDGLMLIQKPYTFLNELI